MATPSGWCEIPWTDARRRSSAEPVRVPRNPDEAVVEARVVPVRQDQIHHRICPTCKEACRRHQGRRSPKPKQTSGKDRPGWPEEHQEPDPAAIWRVCLRSWSVSASGRRVDSRQLQTCHRQQSRWLRSIRGNGRCEQGYVQNCPFFAREEQVFVCTCLSHGSC